MSWATQSPEDWQIGGKCEAYMWGYERHGQLCEGGRVVLTPVNVSAYSIAQQVLFFSTYVYFTQSFKLKFLHICMMFYTFKKFHCSN
jgi:hypothetical protein